MNMFKCDECGRTWIETEGLTKSQCKHCARPLDALKKHKAQHIDENVYEGCDMKYIAD